MLRADKDTDIKLISEKLAKAKGAFVVDFKGMKVEQVTNLRKKLHAAESEMKVVRNTLAKRAFKDHPKVEGAFDTTMKGTNAIVFAFNEVVGVAKTLADFSKDVEALKIKTGIMDGEALDANKIKFLATLPGKDQLRAQLLCLMKEPSARLARVLNEYATKNGAPAATPAADAPQA
ncbi:MAG: ribosomal protein [Pseudobdellovibrio sp.]|jgi:large subunit ribosomal protein L10|nr:ribosomal protein [Pseudobdellovibrio sp.]